MDTSTTGFLQHHTLERYLVRAALCVLEQQLGFVPAWAVLGDYLDGAVRKAARVGVHVIATLASRATTEDNHDLSRFHPCARGGVFDVVELWLENGLMFEVLTPEMQHDYRAGVNLDMWRLKRHDEPLPA